MSMLRFIREIKTAKYERHIYKNNKIKFFFNKNVSNKWEKYAILTISLKDIDKIFPK